MKAARIQTARIQTARTGTQRLLAEFSRFGGDLSSVWSFPIRSKSQVTASL